MQQNLAVFTTAKLLALSVMGAAASAAMVGLSHCYSCQKLATLLSGFLLSKF